MKLKIFNLSAIKDFADYLIEVAETEGSGDDFITDMLASKMSRIEAMNIFKEAVMIYTMYLKVCLINEDYATADKFKRIIKKELDSTSAVILAIDGFEEEETEMILKQIIQEANYINTTNI
jgi:hypothetical protein